MTRILPLYHINFNHVSLSFRQRVLYIEKYFEIILDSLCVDSCVSICTEDLILLKEWNGNCFKKLVNHPKIKFLLGFHNHAIPQLYPDQFVYQAKLGKRIITDLISPDKILPIGYSPEADIFPRGMIGGIAKIWQGIVIGETRLLIDGLSSEIFPAVFNIVDGKNRIKVYLSRRNFEYRDCLHKYLRGEIDEDEVLLGIERDYRKYTGDTVLLARIDLEVLIFNSFIKGEKVFEPPISRWNLLQKHLHKNHVNFVSFDDFDSLIPMTKIPNISNSKVCKSHEEDNKWGNEKLSNFVHSYYLNEKNKINPLILSLFCSDYYCTSFDDWIFEHPCDVEKKIVIHKSRDYRDIESEIKINLLSNDLSYDSILYKITDADMRKYFQMFFRMISITDEYL